MWENGVETGTRYEVDIYHAVAVQLAEAREKSGMTQKQLSQKTKIAQGDISKIERGNANPSLSTLNRLAEGMGMRLEVKFIKQG
ncbi:MAG: helix-turn-helix transcriptional regulator [Lachnospiraceae bacterium]|nr:helix-turn-helix transcriptional regulator [Lachnospiraceae bacterium]